MDFDKEAWTAIPQRTCRYRGNPETGLEIALPSGEVLRVTPGQIARMFAAASAFNRLLEPCRGFTLDWPPSKVATVARWAAEFKARRARRIARTRFGAARSAPEDRYRHLVPIRLRNWLDEHAVREFGRPVSDEEALCMHGAFCGEGLLPMGHESPGDFPVADPVSSLQGLVGQRLIYEENRRFVAVELEAVRTGRGGPAEVGLFLRNLALPGFETDLPAGFVSGSALETLTIDDGRAATYMGIWMLVTHRGTVDRLVDIASGRPGRRDLLLACRRLAFGYLA